MNASRSWFTDSNIKYIKEINFPKNISFMNSFRGNKNLLKIGNITLGSDNVTSAYYGGTSNAFMGCSNLESIGNITFYSVVPIIDNQQSYDFTRTFYACTNLKTIGKINIIGQEYKSANLIYLCYNCSSIESVDISDFNCNYFGWAFAGCSKMKSIKLPNLSSCTYFNSAFDGCNSLETLDFTETGIKNNTSATDFGVFCRNNTKLTEIKGFEFPISVTILERAFENCVLLKTYIDISKLTLLTSAHNMYYKCSSLQLTSEIVFPTTLKTLNVSGYLNACKIEGEVVITTGDSGDIGINFDSILRDASFSKVTLNINTKLTASNYMVGSMPKLSTLIMNWRDSNYSENLGKSAYWSANSGNIKIIHGWCIGIMNSGWMYTDPDQIREVTWVGVAKGSVSLRKSFQNNSTSGCRADQYINQECILDLIENHLSEEGGTLTLGSKTAYDIWNGWGYIDKLIDKGWSVVY